MKEDRALTRHVLIGALCLMVVALLAIGPIEQVQWYHDFADDRTFLGIPNTLDVLSNLAILIPGLMGLRMLNGDEEWLIWRTVFAGVSLTALGSVWYHLSPDDTTMIWDRLPMTVVFAGITSLAIWDRLDTGLGMRVHLPLVLIGLSSIILWVISGDLRPYMFVKHLPIMVVVVLLLTTTSKRYDSIHYTAVLCLFILATAFELADEAVYDLLGFSGHTIKHILAGGACLGLVWMMVNPLPSSAEEPKEGGVQKTLLKEEE